VNALTVLIGGARSGKSDLAVQIGRRFDGPVTFIATARHVDDDMSERIARHIAERPTWPTIEAPSELSDALSSVPDGDLIILDCLTVWLANVMYDDWPDFDVIDAARAAARIASRRDSPTIVVTNEVGLGIHPENDLGRRYRDLLGRVNRIWADAAHQTLFLVAGRVLPLHDPWEFLS
jgi:adenosyl cobinamide kinase/adenosyl cobinamide phosphate guanylyltransferase